MFLLVFKNQSPAGLAVLETSIILSVLLALLIGVSATVDYMRSASQVQSSIDRHLYDSGLKPIEVSARSGIVSAVARRGAVEDYLRSVVAAIAAELSAIAEDNLSSDHYRVEAYSGSIAFSQDGRANLEHIDISVPEIASGKLSVPGTRQRMEQEFSEMTSGRGFLLRGIPTGNYGDETSLQILPVGVLVGIEATVDLQNTFTGRVMSGLGINPVIEMRKAIVLRGDVS
jgi:hypothetical protein